MSLQLLSGWRDQRLSGRPGSWRAFPTRKWRRSRSGRRSRVGRVVEIEGRAVIQVFEGTDGLSHDNAKTKLLGHPMELGLSREMLGRTFDGVGEPIDGLGAIYSRRSLSATSTARRINPVSRQYPRNYIQTGISAIDGLNTLIRGQKLPIFSGSRPAHMTSWPSRSSARRKLTDQQCRELRHRLWRHGRQERRRRPVPPLL
jgi:hypothetical protein